MLLRSGSEAEEGVLRVKHLPCRECTNELQCRDACYILSKPMLIYTVIKALQNQLGYTRCLVVLCFPLSHQWVTALVLFCAEAWGCQAELCGEGRAGLQLLGKGTVVSYL